MESKRELYIQKYQDRIENIIKEMGADDISSVFTASLMYDGENEDLVFVGFNKIKPSKLGSSFKFLLCMALDNGLMDSLENTVKPVLMALMMDGIDAVHIVLNHILGEDPVDPKNN